MNFSLSAKFNRFFIILGGSSWTNRIYEETRSGDPQEIDYKPGRSRLGSWFEQRDKFYNSFNISSLLFIFVFF